MIFAKSKIRCIMIGLSALLCGWAVCVPGVSFADDLNNESCMTCHSDASMAPFVDIEKFTKSIHGANQCVSCHDDIAEIPHPEQLKPVQCSSCHALETEIYLKSDHGLALSKGNNEAAACVSCHGDTHTLLNSRDPQSPIHRLNIHKTCGVCHDNIKGMAPYHLSQDDPGRSYAKSVHGIALLEKGNNASAVCTDCHGSHDLHKATNRSSKLYWQNIPMTCGKCHENVRRTYERSIHGQAVAAGKRDAPVCTDCHGEHTIDAVKLSTSKVFSSHVPETCGQCHAAERITTKYQLPKYVVDTYMESYHGLDVRLGSVTSANCASCHGSHDILPSWDERSSIHKTNLPKTCGKCHAGMTEQVAKGQIHSGRSPSMEHFAIMVVRRIYFALIALIIGFMLFHNGIDWMHKVRQHYRWHTAGAQVVRMTLNERIQHFVLIIAFSVLAYTGFALKYPEAWWASPFVGRENWRAMGHRAAAVVFCIFVLYHVLFIILTKRGREKFKALALRWRDFAQMVHAMAFNLGRRKERPIFGHYSYVEKFEYWALVWGSFIMILTGALLVMADWAMSVLPKWAFDVIAAIHYYEAVLACLAIVVWHGYWVMFDPDEYPMKLTWINGLPSEADLKHRHHGHPHDPDKKSEEKPRDEKKPET